MTAQDNGNSANLEFTGERFTPEISGQIAFEHLHRYYFARAQVEGKVVLDVACGEGYGSDILSQAAASVVGVDIAPSAVEHARHRYGSDKLEFVAASAASLPFDDAQFDVVVSFETIEHHDLHEEMMSEIRRVLKPGGLMIMSSPNKQHYSVEPGYHNPYHVKELFRHEFLSLVRRYFQQVGLLGQRVVHGSLLVASGDGASARVGFDNARLDKGTLCSQSDLAAPLYDLVVASDRELPVLNHSLFEATVHGMDPAGFYGVHLPERLHTADNRIGQLNLELSRALDTKGHLEKLRSSMLEVDGRLGLLGSSFGKVDEAFEKLDEKLEQLMQVRELEQALDADIRRLSRELEATLDRLNGANANFESLSASYIGLESSMHSLNEQLAATESRVLTDEEQLANAHHEIGIRDAQLNELYNSFSWRSTAWLRSLSSLVRGRKR